MTESQKQVRRAYYQKNKHIWHRSRDRFKNDPVKYRQYLDKSYLSINRRYYFYRAGAERRGREFSLTKEQFTILVNGECEYCGCQPCPKNGIDRVENSKGYTVDNCVTCCPICNKMKGTMSTESFIEKCAKISQFKNL